MPEYLLLIHQDEQSWLAADPSVQERTLREHREFIAAHADRLRGGNRLRPVSTATMVRHDEQGRPVITDGVFAESKEVLGGYYLIEAADLDEAIRIAAAVPSPFGGIEVRPVHPEGEP
ncbi:YciI family protein [Nocardia sp. CDC160]|uniref:YciI family protein n=1 Tax=Nocardia sp. CDC160 TaxID=3112166 RepID=UPI002DB84A22|nr:YciI family protein [Nocardia sp. CDC160]MEC3916163.1 YciI family protein [Nocardia sp. CDC160]